MKLVDDERVVNGSSPAEAVDDSVDRGRGGRSGHGIGRPGAPRAGIDSQRMPGHWLLARIGKRVLRPGGRKTTRLLIDRLGIGPGDDVVELAPGMGATADLVLQRDPATYTAVERDPDAAARVAARLRPGTDRCRQGTALHTGLADGSADVVLGEAFLTMQTDHHKEQIVAEAFRVLRPGGRYGLHEMCLVPDDVDDGVKQEIQDELTGAILVNSRPLTLGEWRRLLVDTGFEVRHQHVADLLLLEPRRLLADEGWRLARVVVNILRDPVVRRRVRGMRAAFRRNRRHVRAVALIAEKPR